MISLDTETTGIDLYHGAKPFFVTICHDDGEQQWWEWDVNPFTREPEIPEEDIEEIRDTIEQADSIVLQNCKFDVKALQRIGIDDWPWEKTHDTLIMAHILASNRPKDLTSLAVTYLGINITQLEDDLEEVVKKCRRVCQGHLKDWLIAADGEALLEKDQIKGEKLKRIMPSAKQTVWKYDSWLPKAFKRHLADESGFADILASIDNLDTVLAAYANADSAITLALCPIMVEELKRRGQWSNYEVRMKLPKILHSMENHGVTLSKNRVKELVDQFSESVNEANTVCLNIAKDYDYDLVIPRSGANGSLREFCLDVMELPPVYNPKAKTSTPCLDAKLAIPHYLSILPQKSKERAFIQSLADKRAGEIAVTYLRGYERFWKSLPIDDPGAFECHCGYLRYSGSCGLCGWKLDREWFVLHPSINPTGTDTLRFSFSNPNSANISKREGYNLRYAFGPSPGREWYSFDANNIELRIPAYESGQEEFIALFEKPNSPPYYGSNHLLIAHLLFTEEFESCRNDKGEIDGRIFKKKYAATLYQKVKNGNFAVQYGAVDKADGTGTADRTYGIKGAQAAIKARFSKQEALNQYWIRFAEKHGYIETMPDRSIGAKHGYPLLCTRTEWGRILPTVPLNYHVQGTAMWWMVKAMIRVHEFLESLNNGAMFADQLWPGGYWINMQIHDELVIDMPSGDNRGRPTEYNRPVVDEIKRLMSQGGEDIGVPTPVGCEFHPVHFGEGIPVR